VDRFFGQQRTVQEALAENVKGGNTGVADSVKKMISAIGKYQKMRDKAKSLEDKNAALESDVARLKKQIESLEQSKELADRRPLERQPSKLVDSRFSLDGNPDDRLKSTQDETNQNSPTRNFEFSTQNPNLTQNLTPAQLLGPISFGPGLATHDYSKPANLSKTHAFKSFGTTPPKNPNPSRLSSTAPHPQLEPELQYLAHDLKTLKDENSRLSKIISQNSEEKSEIHQKIQRLTFENDKFESQILTLKGQNLPKNYNAQKNVENLQMVYVQAWQMEENIRVIEFLQDERDRYLRQC
jgi:predicted nuclease with TOPRIM domain